MNVSLYLLGLTLLSSLAPTPSWAQHAHLAPNHQVALVSTDVELSVEIHANDTHELLSTHDEWAATLTLTGNAQFVSVGSGGGVIGGTGNNFLTGFTIPANWGSATLAVRNDTAEFVSFEAFESTSTGYGEVSAILSFVIPCNVNVVTDVTDYLDPAHEACESLILGPDYIAASGSNVLASSGLEIGIVPGFKVEHGASFDAAVCGQSLCLSNPDPMPYGCHSCVNQICDEYPRCCDTEFDQTCVDAVGEICELLCE